MKLGFQYGTKYIEFELEYRKRKTLEISAEPPNIITVVAPLGTTDDIIIKKTKSRAKWII